MVPPTNGINKSQTCWTQAAAYFQPQTAQAVADGLEIISRNGTRFAIRTHGHIPNLGSSNVSKDGIVFDLHKLCSLSLDAAAVVLHVGSGATWGDVYSFLDERYLSAIGGRDTTIGVGGFLLCGGYPALPNLHGTGADGVPSFEVVLADSTIITADAQNHADLYRALKGGGSNFGNGKNPKINLITNVNSDFIVIGLLSADGPEDRPEEFKPITDLTSKINSLMPTQSGTILSLAQAMAHPSKPERRTIGSVATKVSSDLYDDVYACWKEVTSKLPAGVRLHYTIQPVTAAAIQAGENAGHNVMGLEKVSQCWWVFTAEWKQQSDDEAVMVP
ncbi:FAD-binding domain-containing protein [Xylariaceae sp. FL1272]|nr:FAD-binding domain-containing protein [Xylariaceae sp. FL1272]